MFSTLQNVCIHPFEDIRQQLYENKTILDDDMKFVEIFIKSAIQLFVHSHQILVPRNKSIIIDVHSTDPFLKFLSVSKNFL